MSTKMKLTRWFPRHIKPAYVGEYNASICRDTDIMRWWNGSNWSNAYLANTSDEIKKHMRSQKSVVSRLEWRGLANKPRKS